MEELRKIRDENSLRHLDMSNEEISKEHNEAVEWFVARLGRPVEIVTPGNTPIPQPHTTKELLP
jgi:hypothetical protein